MKTRLLLSTVIISIILIGSVSAITQYNSTDGTNNFTIWNGTAGSMTWVAPAGVTNISLLVVSGGGSGGVNHGGGGGAGGVSFNTSYAVVPGTSYTVVIGAGGAASGNHGANSSFGNTTTNITPLWGGAGGNNGANGGAGGSGGGAGSGIDTGLSYSGGANVSGQGFYGGYQNHVGQDGSGGGGGFGGPGANNSGTTGGKGGACFNSSISGTTVSYAAGGSGSSYAGSAMVSMCGVGGIGGQSSAGTAGVNNTGSGGGGGGAFSSAGGIGGTGVVVIQYTLPAGIPLAASFTDTPDPSSTGQLVTFNDTSTGSPTTWNWTFGDIGGSNTSTSQNPTHTYSTAGVYTVFLNVTNSTGGMSNTSGSHTVVNASAFFPQDVWMEGQYVQTFQITDSTTGMPISVVDLTLSPGGSTFTTTNGTGYLTTGFGIYTVTFVSTGYNGKTISYAFDSDQTHAVQLTPANPGGNQNVWYTPWQVRIRIVDYYGKPLPDTNVTAFYIASTLPNTNTTWLTSAYGISPEVATDMVNSAKAMDGRTDDNGGLSFTMFKSLEYHLEIVNSTSGVSATKNLYPSDPEYVIYVRTAGQTAANNTLGLRNGTLPWYSLNSTHISLNMSYIDGTLCTGNVTFRVWFRNNGSELHNNTQSAATGTQITDSHIVLKAPIGTEYLWGYNATTNC